MIYPEKFDVIVIGGGHAGTEAALAPARMGLKTLLLTHNLDTLGQMSCNPAIGGIGKGHLVKEVDALGGIMAIAADQSGIQFRTLNASKGPAVRATRAQTDRSLYRQAIHQALENQENLTLFQQPVDDLIIEESRVIGAITKMGLTFHADAVVLTVGTFLGGSIHIGESNYEGGRAGDPPANTLSEKLHQQPLLRMGRLKTGTPPRLDARTINFSVMQAQPGDDPTPCFSFLGNAADHPQQVPCHITNTTERTHEIIRGGLDRSPMYSGKIEGTGPRYCPSIEDKVVRFAERNSHQIFVEPEGLNTHEIYPNGISTSLPFDVQYQFIRSIIGFENAVIIRPGYAIEYDFFDPRDLKPSLESKFIDGLFFAGQINGTTGYEEAAAQGLIAGLNAARLIQGLPSWTPRRDEAYIGVLIDDLISRGTLEPYRMFTSRAEYRLILREDNADLRLTEKGRELGLVNDHRWQVFSLKKQQIEEETLRLKSSWARPGEIAESEQIAVLGTPLSREQNLLDLLKRPKVSYQQLLTLTGIKASTDNAQVTEQIEIQTKYSGYIERQELEVERLRKHEEMPLAVDFDYQSINALSAEAREKLSNYRPSSIGQASRIPGITPAAISLLLVHLKKKSAVTDDR